MVRYQLDTDSSGPLSPSSDIIRLFRQIETCRVARAMRGLDDRTKGFFTDRLSGCDGIW